MGVAAGLRHCIAFSVCAGRGVCAGGGVGVCVCTLKCVNANVCALSRSVCVPCVF